MQPARFAKLFSHQLREIGAEFSADLYVPIILRHHKGRNSDIGLTSGNSRLRVSFLLCKYVQISCSLGTYQQPYTPGLGWFLVMCLEFDVHIVEVKWDDNCRLYIAGSPISSRCNIRREGSSHVLLFPWAKQSQQLGPEANPSPPTPETPNGMRMVASPGHEAARCRVRPYDSVARGRPS